MPISRIILSSSSSGRVLGPLSTFFDNLVHTTGVSSSVYDALYLYAYNNSAFSSGSITLKFAGSTVSTVPYTIRPTGLITICEGLILSGDGTTGRNVTINPAGSSSIYIIGYVNRIS